MKGGIHIFNVNNAMEANESMTIRDYIAIQAMQAIIASPNFNNAGTIYAVAKDAYRVADAMIKQSEVRDEQSV